MNYNIVTEDVLARLREICGENNVLTDRKKTEAYSHDETPKDRYAAFPEAVVLPRTSEEVARIVRLANDRLIPLTPRGAGSGLSGGAIPCCGGIVVSLENMDRVVEIDTENMMMVVESGVITNSVNERLKEAGLFFAGYPMSLETCCIGGNIAENAGGGKAVKYGVTGRYVMGIEMVTPTGRIVELGGKRVKDVTGYDLKKLIVGSEGTLGIVTRATLKLLPRPTAQVALLVLFDSAESAISVVPKIMTDTGVIPTGIEFMDQLSVKTSCSYLNEHLPYRDCGAMLLIEIDGADDRQVEDDYMKTGEICEKNGALQVYVADNHTTRERVWAVRRSIAEAFMAVSPQQSLEDIVVPTASIAELIPELAKLSDKYDLQIPCYGHAGDGNLHATLVKNPAHGMEQWREIEACCLKDLYGAVRKLGGAISGEHGIGSKRKAYLKDAVSDVELELMKSIKKAFDPNNIMNPGKIFDMDHCSTEQNPDAFP